MDSKKWRLRTNSTFSDFQFSNLFFVSKHFIPFFIWCSFLFCFTCNSISDWTPVFIFIIYFFILLFSLLSFLTESWEAGRNVIRILSKEYCLIGPQLLLLHFLRLALALYVFFCCSRMPTTPGSLLNNRRFVIFVLSDLRYQIRLSWVGHIATVRKSVT